jgi:hypothetical protein
MRYKLSLALALLLWLNPGCADKADKEGREDWGPARWTEMKQDDRDRLLSEDQRYKAKTGFLGKITDAIWEQIVRIYNYMTGDTPFAAAKNMLEPRYPDLRRQAIMYLSKHEYGRQDPYLKYYAEMARSDPDWTVRAMAIRALNRARDKSVTTIYLNALDDKNELVRLEGAKALANIPEPLAVQALIKHLDSPEETNNVRVACADALRCYRRQEVAQVLVRNLRDPQFAVAWTSRRSLKLMTGKDYRYDQSAWLTYLSETNKPFG